MACCAASIFCLCCHLGGTLVCTGRRETRTRSRLLLDYCFFLFFFSFLNSILDTSIVFFFMVHFYQLIFIWIKCCLRPRSLHNQYNNIRSTSIPVYYYPHYYCSDDVVMYYVIILVLACSVVLRAVACFAAGIYLCRHLDDTYQQRQTRDARTDALHLLLFPFCFFHFSDH